MVALVQYSWHIHSRFENELDNFARMRHGQVINHLLSSFLTVAGSRQGWPLERNDSHLQRVKKKKDCVLTRPYAFTRPSA